MKLTGWLAELWIRTGWAQRCDRLVRRQRVCDAARISREVRSRASNLSHIESLEERTLLTTGPGDLLIYYGYPSLINGAVDVAAATSNFAPYEYVVLGAGLEEVTHDDHTNTQAMVTAAATNSTKFFGYVDIGKSTNDYSISVIQTKIDQWAATGVDGIFLDDYGYDFGVTRDRQNAVVDYVHSKGLPVVANGFFVDEVFSPAFNVDYNPNSTATHLAASDYYLFESYQVSEGNDVSESTWRAKADALAAVRNTLPINVLAVTTDDAADVFNQAQFDYAWYSALLDGYVGVGWGQYWFASNDNLAPYRTPPGVAIELNGTGGVVHSNSYYLRKIANDTNTVVVNAAARTGLIATGLDYGDAPDTDAGTGIGNYQTILSNGGPGHLYNEGGLDLLLGASADGENEAGQNAAANGDDAFWDDENGLVEEDQDLILTVGTAPTVRVRVTNATGSSATLVGWIDYNRDGVFDNATERAVATVPSGINKGVFTLSFPVISASALAGATYARFRVSTDSAVLNPTGIVRDGEVEDYRATISQVGDGVADATKSQSFFPPPGVYPAPAIYFDATFGGAVAALGDLDGDGVADIAVGYAEDDTSGINRGAIFIQFMNSNGSVKNSVKITDGVNGGPALANDEYFGSSLASIGDLNGDGVTDLAVGAPFDKSSGASRGAVHLLFLNRDGTVNSRTKIASGTTGAPTLTNGIQFGRSVTAIGDTDGDGFTDLAVGAIGSGAGQFYMLRMLPDGTVKSSTAYTSGVNGVPVVADGSRFGNAIASLGDLDGDGVTDLAVGAPFELGNFGGSVYVQFMNTNGTVKNSVRLARGMNGTPTMDNSAIFGWSLSSIGDLNGDGVTDLVVGAVNQDGGRGTAYVLFLNANGTVKRSVPLSSTNNGSPPLNPNSYFGLSVANVGDLDGDGVTDLAIGSRAVADAPGPLGVVQLLFLRQAFLMDYGDAPDTGAGTGLGNYQTRPSDNGPSHNLSTSSTTLFLGSRVDGESTALPGINATGDDSMQLREEDGLIEPTQDLVIAVGTAPTVRVRATNATTTTATLYGWIDYNRDGIFDNATERASISVPQGSASQTFTLTFPTVAAGTGAGTTYARFRLSTDAAAANPTGAANDGEVEDYAATITLLSGRAVDSTKTVKLTGDSIGTPVTWGHSAYGRAVASLGDLDGDGVVDLAVGDPGDDKFVFDDNYGAVYIQFLNANGTVKRSVRLGSELNGMAVLVAQGGFGTSVAAIGDLDADGVMDLAVGATNQVGGAVYVLFLNSDGTVKESNRIASEINGGPTLAEGAQFGTSIAPIGDLDADGVVDLAVGSSGSVYLLRMTSFGTVKSTLRIASGVNGGPTINAKGFGSAVTSLGDIDNDGVTDLAVGAWEDSIPYTDFNSHLGWVYILKLNANGTVKSSSNFSNVLVQDGFPNSSWRTFGTSLATVGDLDGNGVADLVVGSYIDDFAFDSAGALYVVLLNQDGTPKEWTRISDQANGGPALTTSDCFGMSVTPMGDIDGDGVMDIAVSSWRDQANGAVYLMHLTPPDTTPPRVISFTRNYPTQALTNADTLYFFATFDETVMNVDAADFTLTGTTASISGFGTFEPQGGSRFLFSIGGGDLTNLNGTVGFNLAANASITNHAGLAVVIAEPAIDETFTIDNIAPVLSITPNGTQSTSSSILFTFQFSEAVSSFVAGDITVTNGTKGQFTAIDADTYTLVVNPIADGTVTVSVGAGMAPDPAGNSNLAVTSSVSSDHLSPALTITSNTGASTNVSSILFTFQFTETVSGFTAGDVNVTNGTKGTFTAVDGDTYTLSVAPVADGDVTVSVGAGAAQDAVLHDSLAANKSITSDRTAPTLNVTPNTGIVTTATVTFTFQFNESMTGFTTNDVSVTNGTKGSFVAVDGDTYTLVVTPTVDGTVTVSVVANAAQDAAGNGNSLTTVSVTSDRAAPSLVITPNTGSTNANPITFTFQFSEPVTNFDIGDISITNGTKGVFTAVDGDTFTLMVSPDSDGAVVATVSAGAAQDLTGNNSTAQSATVTADRVAPSLTITPDSGVVSTSTITFTFQFSETVTGFVTGDISITNASRGAFTAVDGDTYTLVVTPTADGAVSATVAAGSVTDLAGNVNALASASVISDRLAPTLSISPNSIMSRSSSTTFTFQFSETVTGFDIDDVSPVNGTKGVFTAVDGDTYTLVVVPDADGTVTVNVAANAAQDVVGNLSNAQSASITVDRVAPTLTISPNSGIITTTTITFTFQFSETVTGFATGDISVVNGTKGAFTAVDGDTYALVVTPSSDAAVNVNVVTSAAQDLAGNLTSATSVSVVSDRASPTLTISPKNGATNANPITFTFQFSEAVTGFDANDISLVNGTAGTFTAVDADTYTLQVTPIADGTVTVNVAAGAAQDVLGKNTVLTTASETSDRTAPTVGVTPNGGTSAANSVTFTFQFSQTVTGFTTSDVTVTNGTKGTFTAVDGDTYTLVVNPVAEGPVTVTVAADSTQDAAGNGNTFGSATIISDRATPTLTITPNSGISGASQITFTFQFSEVVTGFDASDVGLVNGTKGTFTAVDGDTYILVVDPVADGSLTASVAAGAAQDTGGHNTPAASATVTSDRAIPSLSITPDGVINTASTISYTFQFSELVTGFDSSDISVLNGTKGTFTAVDGDTYTLVVTPIADGTVTVSVAANVAQDVAAKGNTAASTSIVSDRTAPSVIITPNSGATNASSITFTFQFNETVTGFDVGDVLVTNGAKGAFTVVDADTYTLEVTSVEDGPVTVSVNAGAAVDVGSHGNTARSASVVSDRVGPTLSISPDGAITNANNVTFTFQFSETVLNFDANDIVVSNGAKGVFTAVDGDTYTLVVAAGVDGEMAVSVAADVAQDAAGNTNAAASSAVTSDRTAPGLVISPNGTKINASTIAFTFQFSEMVTGFDAGDINLTNGTKGLFTTVNDDTYTLLVTPTADGAVAATVPVNAVRDLAGNANIQSSSQVIVDRTPPALTVTPNGITTNASPITFTFQFSEVVGDFDSSDITVTNGSKGTFTAVDGDTYTLLITPLANGSVSATVAADASHDSAGNGNLQASGSVISDRTNPFVTISPNATVTNASSILFTFQFSEAVAGFVAGDINVSNGTKGPFTAVDSDTYTLAVTPVSDGAVTVTVNADVAFDAETNGNTAGSASVTSDRVGPTLGITPNGVVTNASPISFTFQFSETVTGFDASKISVTNGTKGAFTAIDGDTFTLLVTPSADGSVWVNVAADSLQDVAGNNMPLAAGATVASDRTAPQVTITPNSGITNASTTTFTIQFTEAVTGFDVNDVTVGNGTKGIFTALSAFSYTLVVNGVTDGPVSVGVGANAGVDSAGNGNLAANVSVTRDRTAPTLTITPNGTLTNATAITFTFQFSEIVTGFTAGDISISGGTPGTFTSLDGDTYTLVVMPSIDGTVTASVAADLLQDVAGNKNVQTSAAVSVDRTVPSVSIAPNSGITNADSITFEFQFSEAVSGFNAADIQLTNGDPGPFSVVDADTYTLVVFPQADGDVRVSVPAQSAQDAAGNANAFSSAAITVDRTSPALTISPNGTTTNASVILFTFQFAEVVTGFDTGDISVVNGTKGAFTRVDGDTYTLNVTPQADGAVSVSVAANAAQDAAGNKNVLTSASVTEDRTTPLLSITPNSGTSNSSTLTFTFQFSETVTGFAASDIAVTNGTKSTFTAVDGDTYTLVVTPIADGTVSASVNANAAFDVDNNGSQAANASVISDRRAPSLSITPNGTLSNAAALILTFQFSESVSGFDASDVLVVNGTKVTFTAVDFDTYTLVVAPVSDGEVQITVNSNAANDVATNGNTAATASITSDRSAPPLSITPNDIQTTSATITFTFQFGQSVTAFDASDINVTNGTKGTFTAVDSDTFTLVVSPLADGPVVVGVDAGHAFDLAGNGNSAASASIVSDRSVPVFGSSATASVLENAVTLPSVVASDVHGPVKYAIDGGLDATFFTLDQDTGELRWLVPPDYEVPTDSDGDRVYRLRIKATDALGLFSFQDLAVTVTPVNEHSPIFTSHNFSVVEHLTAVGTVTATDADLPVPGLTYSITGGDDAERLTITAAGVLTFRAAPDFSHPSDVGADNTYHVTITVTDNGTAPRSTSQVIVVSVTSSNSAPSDITLSAASVSELQPVGTVVGTFRTTDPNIGNSFIYTLVPVDGSDDHLAFTVDNGELRTAVGLDFETQAAYSIRVRTTDQGGLFLEKLFTITLTNVNEPPTLSSFTEQMIAEDTATGSLPFFIADPESPAASLTVRASSSNAALIPNANVVLGGTDAERALVVTPASNQTGSATISVTVSDGTRSITRSFQVTVLAVDDPVRIVLSPQPLVFRVSGKKEVAIDATATISDVDTPNLMFAGAVLQVSGQSAKDKLSILKLNGISRKGKNVLVGSTVIGTVSGGTKGAPLMVQLNGVATQPSVQNLLRSLGYRSVDKVPSERSMRIEITNIGGINTNPATRQIQVIP